IPSSTTSANARRMISPVQGSASQCQMSVVMLMVVSWQENAFAGCRDCHDGAAIGRGERFARQRLFGCAERNLAPVQAEDQVPRPGLLDVVRRDQQAVAAGGEVCEEALEPVCADGVETG